MLLFPVWQHNRSGESQVAGGISDIVLILPRLIQLGYKLKVHPELKAICEQVYRY